MPGSSIVPFAALMAILLFGPAGCCDGACTEADGMDDGSQPDTLQDTDADEVQDALPEQQDTPADEQPEPEDDMDDEDAAGVCECDDPSCGLGLACTEPFDPCPCANVCSYAAFEGSSSMSFMDEFYCYAECETTYDCPGERDDCMPMGPGEDAPLACIEPVPVESETWRIKFIPYEHIPVMGDYEVNDVRVTLEGETIVFPVSLGIHVSFPELFVLMFEHYTLEAVWQLQIIFPGSKWTEGELEMYETVGETLEPVWSATLIRYDMVTGGDSWIEAIGVDGTVSVTSAGEACPGLECERSAGDYIHVDMVAIRGSMTPYEE
jgi:hypothetical protein